MMKQIKYPNGVAVIRGSHRAIQLCIDNLKLVNNIEYCDFREINYIKYIMAHDKTLSEDEAQYFYEQGIYDDIVYRSYVEDVCNIIKENVVDVLIVNNNKYIKRLMEEHEIGSRNIINIAGINYFINLVSHISDNKRIYCE